MRGEGNHKIPASFAPENMEKTGAERVKYSLACQHEDAIPIKFVPYAQKCPTVLCTFAVALRKESVDRNAGRAQRGPQTTPLNACGRLAALPARATSGGGLSACAWGCRWHSLRNNARASRADGAAAMPPLHYRAAGALSRPRAHKPCRAARPLPLAAYRWPHLGGARPPGPVTGLGRLARPGLNNGPYSGLWPSAALARTRARLAGAIAASDKPAIAG